MNERVRQEVGIHARLKHPAIVELKTFFEDADFVYLVLELCHNGELAKYLKNTKHSFSEPEARIIFDQVVSGVEYLHSHKIMHRDLTLNNLMITREMKVKIGDFGLATKIQSPSERHVTMCGTPNFISPEVATRSNHGLEADVWGLGCLLYTLLVGKPPFETAGVMNTLTKVVMGEYYLPDNLGLSMEVRDLIDNLLKSNPSERIKLNNIINHPWMMMDSSPPQDSGMYTMTTTNFSSNSISKPGPKPVAAFPVLTEYSEENEVSQPQYRPMFPTSHSTPMLSRPTTPQLTSLRSRMSPLPTMTRDARDMMTRDTRDVRDMMTRDTRDVSMLSQVSVHHQYPALSRQLSTPCLDTDVRSLRSNFSDPPQHQPQFNSHQNSLQSAQPRYTSLSQHSQPSPQPRPTSPASTLPPRLTSTRLRPTRQRNKNVMANISPNGEVCLEFIKSKRGQEVVSEVMRVSADGERIVIYTPASGSVLGSAPPPLPTSGADSFHSYSGLPAKYHKKYQYAARFVNLVKASTPKMTLYTSQAKCYLMENDAGDFEAYFYNGTKVTIIDGIIKTQDKDGLTQSWKADSACPPSLSMTVSHVNLSYQHCHAVQSLLAQCDQASSSSLPTFPLILGRKPPLGPGAFGNINGNNSLEKENRDPTNVVVGMTDTIISKATALTETSRQARTVRIPDIGVASQLPDGNVRVNYDDGSSLVLRSNSANVEFCPRAGQWTEFAQENMSAYVRAKLEQMPLVLDRLRNR